MNDGKAGGHYLSVNFNDEFFSMGFWTNCLFDMLYNVVMCESVVCMYLYIYYLTFIF